MGLSGTSCTVNSQQISDQMEIYPGFSLDELLHCWASGAFGALSWFFKAKESWHINTLKLSINENPGYISSDVGTKDIWSM